MTKEDKSNQLNVINNDVKVCQSCGLSKTRQQTVFGEGNIEAQVVFLGEAPGASEDETGRPFVGRAGKLLDNMIASMELKREDVFILNICKCRPPNNRKPTPKEMAACKPFLTKQLEIIRPKFIVALGNTALEGLTGSGGITSRCGKWEDCDVGGFKARLMPCYHPSALLRNPNWKAPAWTALNEVKKEMHKLSNI